MRSISGCGVFTLCLALSVGCVGRDDDRHADERAGEMDIAETTTIVETGCLTATGERFVLTALEGGGRRAETEMYELVGGTEDLRRHVGREVQVTGMAEPAQVADVTELSPPAPVGTSGRAEGTQPQVQIETETRLEARRMRVSTVTPTGEACVEAVR